MASAQWRTDRLNKMLHIVNLSKHHDAAGMMKTQGGVYKITCTVDGRLYIGSSFCMSARWKEHRYHLGRGEHRSRHLQRAWNKYGADAFVFEVLQYEADRDAREVLEQKFLDELQPFGAKGFNSARDVGTTRGIKLTEEHRRKISERSKLHRHSAASKELQRLSKLGALNPQYGKPMPEATKEALRAAHPWRGKQHSDETKRRLSEHFKLLVWQIARTGEILKLWPCSADAAAALGLCKSTVITKACCTPHWTAGGFFWRYARDFDAATFVVPTPPAHHPNCKPVNAMGRRGEVLWSWPSEELACRDLGISKGYVCILIRKGRGLGDVTFAYADVVAKIRSELK